MKKLPKSMYSSFVPYYDAIFPYRDEVFAYLWDRLEGRGSVLDLGCGTGHYVGAFQKRGIDASGVDLDPAMIEKAGATYPLAAFQCADIADVDFGESSRGLIFSVGNVLPHLSRSSLMRCIGNVRKMLLPSGRWIFQIMNWDYFLTLDEYEFPVVAPVGTGLRFFRDYRSISEEKVVFSTRLEKDGETIFQDSVNLYPFRSETILEIHRDAGFESESRVCDFQGNPFDPSLDGAVLYTFRKPNPASSRRGPGKSASGKLPPWIRVKVHCGSGREEVQSILERHGLHTVCSSARCPNLAECWHQRTATFMILGDHCTRNCRFCAVSHDLHPAPVDKDEPLRIAAAAEEMKLRYVVVTSVTRDDLPDGGAGHFAAVVRALRRSNPDLSIEVLTPDFNLDEGAIRTVVESSPSVFNHNVETVKRLSRLVRHTATYDRSLRVLEMVVRMGEGRIPVKSGLMVGLGETDAEVAEAIHDIRNTGAEGITIGQYLPPTKEHWRLDRYVHPEQFEEWAKLATHVGFRFVASAPLVRSSYHARELFEKPFVKRADSGILTSL